MDPLPNQHRLQHDERQQRFLVHLINEDYAEIKYQLTDITNTIAVTSTKVPDHLQGKGYGKQMMEIWLPQVAELGWMLIPVCDYVKYYLQRHPQWHALWYQEDKTDEK